MLEASNANGRDTNGYSVGSRRQLDQFLRSFFSIPLGQINNKKQINWIAPNWRTMSSQEKVEATSNTEAKKLMELVVHVATEEQLTTLAKPSPESTVALAEVLQAKKTAIESVVGKVLQFLHDHEAAVEPKTPKSDRQSPPKVATTGALIKRWKTLKYTKLMPVEKGANTTIQTWGSAGLTLQGTSAAATSSDSSQSNAKKRSREN
jgi:hypothetical protein